VVDFGLVPIGGISIELIVDFYSHFILVFSCGRPALSRQFLSRTDVLARLVIVKRNYSYFVFTSCIRCNG
jgi:hypothetical protein